MPGRSNGRTTEQVRELSRQARQSASCCSECFCPLAPPDSVTMVASNLGRQRHPNWVSVPICLLCTLESIKLWRWRGGGSSYFAPTCHRTRCVSCQRPMRVYGNRRTCCIDCQRAVSNQRNKLRRRVTHQPMACVECGSSFVPKRADALTCSNRCRQALHRERTEWDDGE